MFWAVEQTDRLVSQIDPVRLTETPYSAVNHKRAVRYWWIPVPLGLRMAGFRHNPLLHKHCVDARGSQGFVARRTKISIEMGKAKETPEERIKRLLAHPPVAIACYIVGIEGGPRLEIYPDGTVLKRTEPRSAGETQAVLR
jgi:hypothetical protein